MHITLCYTIIPLESSEIHWSTVFTLVVCALWEPFGSNLASRFIHKVLTRIILAHYAYHSLLSLSLYTHTHYMLSYHFIPDVGSGFFLFFLSHLASMLCTCFFMVQCVLHFLLCSVGTIFASKLVSRFISLLPWP